jgi:hypothetical protein
VDARSKQHPAWSPYAYVLANPLKLVDPDGRQVEATSGFHLSLQATQASPGNPEQAQAIFDRVAIERAKLYIGGLLLVGAVRFAPNLAGALARWALTNPGAATEVGAAVGGALLEGTEDLCPTCKGDELGRVVGRLGDDAAGAVVKGVDRIGDALSGLRSGRNSGVKIVESAEDIEDLFGHLSSGGKIVESTTYPGRLFELPDGTTVGLRTQSKSGGPTIDIKLPDGTEHKVHVQQ